MKLIDLGNKNLTSEDLKINDCLYGCICSYHSAKVITNIWNGEVVVDDRHVIISQGEGITLVCSIDDELEDDEIYTLKWGRDNNGN